MRACYVRVGTTRTVTATTRPHVRVQDGVVHTAGDGILEGTVRRLVLEVCAEDGVPVVLAPPTLASVATWAGAFLTSTSRLVLPIDTLAYSSAYAAGAARDGGSLPPLDAVVTLGPPCALLARLEARVADAVARHSDALA